MDTHQMDGAPPMQTMEQHTDVTGWQQIEAAVAVARGISTSEAAQRLGVSPSTIRRWIKLGHLEATRTPAGYVVDASGLGAARERARTRKPRNIAQEDCMLSEQPARAPEGPVLRAPAQPDQPVASEPVVEAAPPEPGPPARVAPHVDRGRVLEGLQRSIILEQAKRQRAARRKDPVAMRDCAWRLEALYAQLADAREDERKVQGRDTRGWAARLGASLPPASLASLAQAANIAKHAPSRRAFNVATILMLNGLLMMLMTFIA